MDRRGFLAGLAGLAAAGVGLGLTAHRAEALPAPTGPLAPEGLAPENAVVQPGDQPAEVQQVWHWGRPHYWRRRPRVVYVVPRRRYWAYPRRRVVVVRRPYWRRRYYGW
jgi:hypothetical protein